MTEPSSQTCCRSRRCPWLQGRQRPCWAIPLSSSKRRPKRTPRESASEVEATSWDTTPTSYLASSSIEAINQPFSTLGKIKSFFQNLQSRLVHLAVRNCFYKTIYDLFKPAKARNDLNASQKALLSGLAGSLGAVASNGFSAQFIRKVADLGRPEKFIRKDVGYDFFSGLKFNVLRAFLLNSVMIGPYMSAKMSTYNTFGDTFLSTPVGLFVASLVGTAAVLPLDNLRTRLMAQYRE